MDTQSRHEKELVLAQVLYIYVLPTLLLYYGVIPGQFRLIILLGVALLLYGIIQHAHWTFADLEIRKNFLKDFLPYAIFTIIGVISIVLIAQYFHPVRSAEEYEWWEDIRFLLLFIPISVLQEIVFRGVLMHMLRRAFNSVPFIILLNASLFALIHIIYLNLTVVLPITFIGGIGFAWIYYKYPNLILISISHTILNFTAMILGFFVLR
jgi:membrane protease YdiL (CAAX protease family)